MPLPFQSLPTGIWRASELAAYQRVARTGYAALDAELPGGGWPLGALTELLLTQPGIGELRLLRPALQACEHPILLIRPPHIPQPYALTQWGWERVTLVTPPAAADGLWAAEQALRAGTCGAVLLWHDAIPAPALRRLHLAAQACDTLLMLIRAEAATRQASPAPLRLALAPALGGVRVQIVKRRGPPCAHPVFVPVWPSPILVSRYAALDRRVVAAPGARRPAAVALPV